MLTGEVQKMQYIFLQGRGTVANMINKMRIQQKYPNSGFTLVELMVVVAIIAVLVTIAIPIFSSSTEKAEEKTDLANLRILNGVTAVYRSTVEGDDPFSSSEDSEALMELLVPKFIAEEPLPQQEEIQFSWNLAEQRWIIVGKGSEGEPGVPGGENDNNDEENGEDSNIIVAGNFTFDINRGMVISYSGPSGTGVEIPSEIEGHAVIGIGDNAFNGKGLTSVVIPEGLLNIGKQAFRGNNLTELNIPESVQSIGEGAFRQNKLMTLSLPDSVSTIGVRAFNQNEITELKLPGNLEKLGGYSFADNKINSVTIPEGLKEVDGYAFRGNQLTEISFPDSIEVIGSGVLQGNDIVRITLGNNVNVQNGLLYSNNPAAEHYSEALYNKFRDTYLSFSGTAGERAGTYIFNMETEEWQKQ